MAKTLVLGIASMLMFGNNAGTLENTIVSSDNSEPPAITRELAIEKIIQDKSKENGVNGELAQAIAFCESTYRQYNTDGNVLRGIQNSQDVGLFQINEHYHLERSRSLGHDIYTLEGNIDYAMDLLKNDGSRHWNASRPCWGNKIAMK